MPKTPTTKREFYNSKFGPDRFDSMVSRVVNAGRHVGIEFSYDGDISSTIDSHRLLARAYEQGGEPVQRSVLEKLFKGYFEEVLIPFPPCFVLRETPEEKFTIT
jgi:predicted DsbA family dithiol-disulfide isomerase